MTAATAWAFLIVWSCCHLIYPLWYPLHGSFFVACSLFVFLIALGMGLFSVLPLWDSGIPEEKPLFQQWLPRDPVLWSLLALATAIRIYPMTLPVHLSNAGDEAVHMGFPALPFKLWSRNAPIPIFLIFWTLLAIAFFSRRFWMGKTKIAFSALAGLQMAAVGAIALGAALYFGLVFKTVEHLTLSGYPTLPADLLRTPPLGHWIHALFYAMFGVSDFTGRLPEFLFSSAGAVLIYQLALEFRSRTAARIAAILYLFLPPLGYYAMRGSQTHGELFFDLLTAYSFAKWLRNGNPATLCWAVLAVSTGTLYRYTVLPLVPILAAMVGIFHWLEPRKLPLSRQTVLHCSALILAMTLPWTISYFCYKLRPYEFGSGHSFLEGLIDPALSLPSGVSWPMAVLMAIGVLATACRTKDRLQWYLIGWFMAYYLFISADLGWDVRLTLPLYPPLILWTADWIATIAGDGMFGLCAGGVLGIYLVAIGTWFYVPPLQPEFNLRYSLETEYVPLKTAARTLGGLAPGTRVLSVDCSRGCFSFYLSRPDNILWTVADSKQIASLRDLIKICREKNIQTVLYTAGTVEVFVTRNNPDLFSDFVRDNSRFAWRADYQFGQNRIAIKDFRD